MENPFYINKGNQLPNYAAEIVDTDGATPVNLTGAAIYFKLTDAVKGTVVISSTAVVTSASVGLVKYMWSTSDTNLPGVYKAKFEVWSLTGGMFSVPRLPDEEAYVIVQDRVVKGSYIVSEEVFNRYPVMRTYGMSTQIVDTDLIPQAEAELNGRLAVAFPIPITNGASSYLLKDLAIELTYCKALYNKEPKQASERYQMVVKKIDDIVNGKIALPDVSSGGSLAAGVEVWSTTMDYPPVHGMLDAQDSRIDPYQKSDEWRKRYFGTTGEEDIE